MSVYQSLANYGKPNAGGFLRFLWSILMLNFGANVAALFVVLFIFDWNQYLWPIMITHTKEMRVVVVGIRSLIYLAP